MPDQRGDITCLLESARVGDRDAQEKLFRRVESELRQAASRYLRREQANASLQPTLLVDEVFVRLVVDGKNIKWQDRAHFYRTAARAMRRFLVDHERERVRKKRGGGQVSRIELDLTRLASRGVEQPDLLALDEALKELEQLDVRQGHVVELHHFGGHSLKETAELLGVSSATVKTDWASARAWLHKKLS